MSSNIPVAIRNDISCELTYVRGVAQNTFDAKLQIFEPKSNSILAETVSFETPVRLRLTRSASSEETALYERHVCVTFYSAFFSSKCITMIFPHCFQEDNSDLFIRIERAFLAGMKPSEKLASGVRFEDLSQYFSWE